MSINGKLTPWPRRQQPAGGGDRSGEGRAVGRAYCRRRHRAAGRRRQGEASPPPATWGGWPRPASPANPIYFCDSHSLLMPTTPASPGSSGRLWVLGTAGVGAWPFRREGVGFAGQDGERGGDLGQPGADVGAGRGHGACAPARSLLLTVGASPRTITAGREHIKKSRRAGNERFPTLTALPGIASSAAGRPAAVCLNPPPETRAGTRTPARRLPPCASALQTPTGRTRSAAGLPPVHDA